MTAYVERRVAYSAEWAAGLASFAAILFIVAGLGHRFGTVETVAFFWILGIVFAVAATALALSIRALHRVWRFGDIGAGSTLRGAAIAVVVLIPFLVSAGRIVLEPRLTDISTDTADPPSLEAAARNRTAGMNPVRPISADAAELQRSSYPDVTGRRYEASPDRVLEAVNKVIDARGWSVTRRSGIPAEQDEITIEAVARTFFLGFPSDVAVRLTDEGDTTYVDVRSASRYAAHDLGDNARRIVGFLADLDAEMTSQAGK